MTTSERRTKSFSTTVSSLPSAGEDFQSVVNQDLLKAYTVLQGQVFEHWGTYGLTLHSPESLVSSYRHALNGITYTDLLTLRYISEIPLTKIDVTIYQHFVNVLNQIQHHSFGHTPRPSGYPRLAPEFEMLDDYWVEADPVNIMDSEAAYLRFKKKQSGKSI